MKTPFVLLLISSGKHCARKCTRLYDVIPLRQGLVHVVGSGISSWFIITNGLNAGIHFYSPLISMLCFIVACVHHSVYGACFAYIQYRQRSFPYIKL